MPQPLEDIYITISYFKVKVILGYLWLWQWWLLHCRLIKTFECGGIFIRLHVMVMPCQAHMTWTHAIHTYHAHMLCTLAMHTCQAHMPCYAHMPCTYTMHTCEANIPCTHVMHTYHILISYIDFIYWYHILILGKPSKKKCFGVWPKPPSL